MTAWGDQVSKYYFIGDKTHVKYIWNCFQGNNFW